jgi:hypothetical protein
LRRLRDAHVEVIVDLGSKYRALQHKLERLDFYPKVYVARLTTTPSDYLYRRAVDMPRGFNEILA